MTTKKHLKVTAIMSGNHDQQHQDLIPGLPDHLSHLCLTSLPPTLLYKVSHSWRKLIYSPCFPPFLALYALLAPDSSHDDDSELQLFSFDPIASTWTRLPPLPTHFLLRHPSFLSRNLPIQSVSVNGKLVLFAATAPRFLPALTRPLIFDPIKTGKWSYGPELASPRRWCAAGTSKGSVYVASGIGSHYSSKVAKSVEKWDFIESPNRDKFEEMRTLLKDGRFSREAIEAVGYKGKLCMVNVKGDAVKEGVVYDTENDVWEEMGEGMLWGWRGPAASMAEEEIYTVDEKKGVLMRYSGSYRGGGWKEVVESERLKGAEHIAAGGGRVVVGRGGCGGGIAVVDVVAAPPRIWVVDDVPPGYNVAGLHILPRINNEFILF